MNSILESRAGMAEDNDRTCLIDALCQPTSTVRTGGRRVKAHCMSSVNVRSAKKLQELRQDGRRQIKMQKIVVFLFHAERMCTRRRTGVGNKSGKGVQLTRWERRV